MICKLRPVVIVSVFWKLSAFDFVVPGQTKNVNVYRIITRGTYEETMFERSGMKLGLDRAVLSRMDSERFLE